MDEHAQFPGVPSVNSERRKGGTWKQLARTDGEGSSWLLCSCCTSSSVLDKAKIGCLALALASTTVAMMQSAGSLNFQLYRPAGKSKQIPSPKQWGNQSREQYWQNSRSTPWRSRNASCPGTERGEATAMPSLDRPRGARRLQRRAEPPKLAKIQQT